MTTKVNERALVLEMLLAVNEEGQYSHLVLRDVLDKYQYLGKQERAFLTRLMEGTLERQLTLDYVIDQFSKTRVKKMKPLIRNLMRMSVYQIMYMDSVPDSAVCNEAVKLARKRGFSGLSGFVNGVLRSVARGWREVRFPNLSVTYSMPEWIVDIWTENYGEEKTRQILEGLTAENRLTIRTNLSAVTPEELVNKLKAEGVTVHAVPELPYAFEISGLDYLAGLKSFKEGLFYVQDVSSMLVAETAAPKKNDYVIDVCAAPGGKSTHMAELLQGSGMVEARDLTEYKVDLIRENIARHGLSNMKAVQMDATVDDPDSHQKADVLVCDLPCSGLGVMGKKIITLFNKQDAPGASVLRDFKSDYTLKISAKTGEGLDDLNDLLEKLLAEEQIYVERLFPYSEAGKIQLIREYGQLISEEYTDEGIAVKARVPKEIYPKVV